MHDIIHGNMRFPFPLFPITFPSARVRVRAGLRLGLVLGLEVLDIPLCLVWIAGYIESSNTSSWNKHCDRKKEEKGRGGVGRVLMRYVCKYLAVVCVCIGMHRSTLSPSSYRTVPNEIATRGLLSISIAGKSADLTTPVSPKFEYLVFWSTHICTWVNVMYTDTVLGRTWHSRTLEDDSIT